MGKPLDRPVCIQSHCKGFQLVQSNLGSLGLSGQRSSSRLVQGAFLSVSSSSLAASSSAQNRKRGVRGHCYHSLVAKKRLVSPPTKSPSRLTSSTSRASRSHSRPVGPKSPRSWDPLANCLESLGGILQVAGISRQAAHTIYNDKRKFTRDLYHSKWQNFSRWCEGGGIDPPHATAPEILDNLEHLSSISLQHNTILTHLLTLSSCSSLLGGFTVGSHTLISAWVKGHRADVTPKKIRVPPWKLPLVPVALTEGDFELLHSVKLELVA